MYINRRGIVLLPEIRNEEHSFPVFVVHKFPYYKNEVSLTKRDKVKLYNKYNRRKGIFKVLWKTYYQHNYYKRLR
jgi:hypothetical protein